MYSGSKRQRAEEPGVAEFSVLGKRRQFNMAEMEGVLMWVGGKGRGDVT